MVEATKQRLWHAFPGGALSRMRAIVDRFGRLTPRMRLLVIALGGVLIVGLVIGLVREVALPSACTTRDQAIGRAAAFSSDLQAAASQGKLKIPDLASAIRRMNAAATAYGTNGDAIAYCNALEGLRSDLDLSR